VTRLVKQVTRPVKKVASATGVCLKLLSYGFRSVSYYTDQSSGEYLVYTPFHTENAGTATVVWQSVANSLIMLGVIVVMTVFLVLLYKYR